MARKEVPTAAGNNSWDALPLPAAFFLEAHASPPF